MRPAALRAAAPAAAALAIAWCATWATAQQRPGTGTILLAPQAGRPGGLSQHAIPPLTAPQQQRLSRAMAMNAGGQADSARDVLVALLTELPHHPIVLGELARLYVAREKWSALERLGRSERAATHDSILLGRELSLALERQSRAREAAQVAIEAWTASADEGGWCAAAIARLDELDGRAALEPLQRAAAKTPRRLDLVLAAARLSWTHQDRTAAWRLLAAADAAGASTPARWTFAEELLHAATGSDSSGAMDALLDLAADRSRGPEYRLTAARRAWQLSVRRGTAAEGTLRLATALADLPPNTWSADLLVGIVRGLRESGHTVEVRALLDRLGDRRSDYKELALEGALTELREGPPARALPALEGAAHGSPEGVFRYAEALFFAGMPDSAASMYRLVTSNPASPYTGPALERLFLIEDAEPRGALTDLGRMAYESWRGDSRRAGAIAESLYRTLSRGPLWAQAALALGDYRDRAGDGLGALEPLLAVADSLPQDRLAPVARERAGDVYRLRLKDEAKALAQYEECLARYPKAWNAPEVRRVVQMLRRERRF